MTKLQELVLRRNRIAEQQKEAFGKYEDVSQMPQDDQKLCATRNDQLKELDIEIEHLTQLEEMKSAATTPFRHSIDENTKAAREQENRLNTREREVARVKSLPRYGRVQNFRGEDKELKAYQFGNWFIGTILHEKQRTVLTEKARQYCMDWGLSVKAQSEGVNTAGGYLVPNEFANDIIDLREEYGVFRRNTKVVPMARETKSVPRRVSGLTVYYPGEGVAITESSKVWDMVNLMVRKYACLAIYSSELSEDAIISIGDDLAQEVAYAFALAEDTNGFNGDGTSAYAGTTGVRQKLVDTFTTSGGTGLILVSDIASTDRWAEILLTDFEKMLGALPIYARRNAKWFCSSTFFHTVMHKLQLAAGGNSAIDIANGGSYRFLGMPVVESQVFPVTPAASHVPCILGDLALASKLGDRRELTLAMSDQYRFAEDQIAIKGTQRIDINVHDVGATGVAGPVVGLLTNASAS